MGKVGTQSFFPRVLAYTGTAVFQLLIMFIISRRDITMELEIMI